MNLQERFHLTRALTEAYFNALPKPEKLEFKQKIEKFSWRYELVGQENFHLAFNEISKFDELVIDTETTGLNHRAQIIGAVVGVPALERAYYFAFGHISPGFPALTEKKNGELTKRSAMLKALFPVETPRAGERWPGQCTVEQMRVLTRELFFQGGAFPHTLIFHNSKFDCKMFIQTFGCDLVNGNQARVHDTMLAAKCIATTESAALTECGERFLGFSNAPEEIRIKDLCARRGQKDFLGHSWKSATRKAVTYYQLSPEDIVVYACADVETTARLWPILQKKIAEYKIENLYQQEVDVSKIILDIEIKGIKIDRAYLESCLPKCETLSKHFQERADAIVGWHLEMGKAAEIIKAFNQLGVDLKALTATAPGVQKDNAKAIRNGKKPKEIAVGEEVLKLTGHELGLVIIDWNAVDKIRSTFIKGVLDKLDENDFLHGNLNQVGADTGRFSSSDPNLQNMPRGALALESPCAEDIIALAKSIKVRNAFLADDASQCMVKVDYSQMELRNVAWLVDVVGMLESFKNGVDLHAFTRDNVNKYLIEKGVAKEGTETIDRYEGKTMNFQILYGSGAPGLAGMLRKDVKLMYDILSAWHETYPEIKNAMDRIKEIHSYHSSPNWRGYVKNLMGRRYRVKNGLEYILLNYLIQGGCADMMKEKIVAVYEWLKREIPRARIVNTIHDELLFSWPKDELHRVDEVVKIMGDFATEGKGVDSSIRRPAITSVVMEAEASICPNCWGESIPFSQWKEGFSNA